MRNLVPRQNDPLRNDFSLSKADASLLENAKQLFLMGFLVFLAGVANGWGAIGIDRE
jgi:hypothetical protein